MKERSTFLNRVVDFFISLQAINWGLINFLIEICLVFAGVVFVCHYDPQLTAPLIMWVGTGFLIFMALIVATILTSALVTRFRSAREQVLQQRIQYYEAQLKKEHKSK